MGEVSHGRCSARGRRGIQGASRSISCCDVVLSYTSNMGTRPPSSGPQAEDKFQPRGLSHLPHPLPPGPHACFLGEPHACLFPAALRLCTCCSLRSFPLGGPPSPIPGPAPRLLSLSATSQGLPDPPAPFSASLSCTHHDPRLRLSHDVSRLLGKQGRSPATPP